MSLSNNTQHLQLEGSRSTEVCVQCGARLYRSRPSQSLEGWRHPGETVAAGSGAPGGKDNYLQHANPRRNDKAAAVGCLVRKGGDKSTDDGVGSRSDGENTSGNALRVSVLVPPEIDCCAGLHAGRSRRSSAIYMHQMESLSCRWGFIELEQNWVRMLICC